MNIEELRNYCLSLPDTFDCFPFDEDAMVFKVRLTNGSEKMFGLISLSKPDFIALKCDPEWALELRERHPEITPAYHFNKKHWNGVRVDGALSRSLICELIDHSYKLVRGRK